LTDAADSRIRVPLACGRGVILACVLFCVASGEWTDTSTGIDLDKLPRFPLVKLRSGFFSPGSRAAFDGIRASAPAAPEQEVRLRGAGKSGKKWEAHLFGLDEVWRGDLDANGTQDYVVSLTGPYVNGRTTALFSLSILLMDRDRLPTPFFTALYHGESGEGVKHLVHFNRGGGASLLISSYDEIPSDARVGPFCSGHWVTQLYEFRDLGAEEMRGAFGGIHFPFIRDWTYRGSDCAETEDPTEVRPPVLYENGTLARGAPDTTIQAAEAGNVAFRVNPVEGCNTIVPRVIVFDRPELREIAFPNLFSGYAADLAERIRRAGAHVQLRGIGKRMGKGVCAVNLLWAG